MKFPAARSPPSPRAARHPRARPASTAVRPPDRPAAARGHRDPRPPGHGPRHGPGARRRRCRGRAQRRPDDLRPLPQPRSRACSIQAGITVVDTLGAEIFDRVKDGTRLRVHDGEVFDGDDSLAVGRERRRRARRVASWSRPAPACTPSSRASPTTAPSSCGASRTCCCTARGCRAPPPTWPVARSWSSCAATAGRTSCAGIKPFIREQRPGPDRRRPRRRRPGGRRATSRTSSWPAAPTTSCPSAAVLRKARDVVVLVERGAPRSATERFERHRRPPAALRDGRHDRGRRAAPRLRRSRPR